jgi:hypothetical protein
VKKRVERSSTDPSVVITTYEGQHCHHIASYQRVGGGAAHIHHSPAAVALAEQMSSFIPARQLYSLPPLHPQSSPSSDTIVSLPAASTSLQHLHGGDDLQRTSHSPRVSMSMVQSPRTPSSVSPAVSVEKAGLLDDMVPQGVRHG